ncbi:DUF6289 family protein [Brevundimonas sp. Bb-A]|uniref:DUF6289 family protein n=1 Tax=unclassified Brevundimonas TaxID=2622653 RepID=UPI001D13586D
MAQTWTTETIYYSDATLSSQVGYVIRHCDQRVYRSGIQTEFAVTTTEPCDDDRDPNP